MRLRVLGCSGGVGGNLRTTSMLLDNDVLIDAGTGACDLSLEELSLIDHVFLTHSHLDHIVSLPFMLDSVAFMRNKPLTIYATQETIESLQQHIFNWKIWPDFSQIPNFHQPCMLYQSIATGETVKLGEREITALPANHVVPAVGFQLDSGAGSLVFTGDTTTQDVFWDMVNRIGNLRYLIIESAFSDAEKELAIVSRHLCPGLLSGELLKLKSNPDIYVTHLKPGEGDLTMQEISKYVQGQVPKMLTNGHVFEF
ncbi:MAG: 3',5'-cyclic-nucleotide phosphodiesterase [Gallionellales bacterium 35-53-114]|nr:MAG: 3',5'-cyclic-nucleotide phosphodiesterase [Gallionellales bacterium 35-53-114]OYZ64128.1 MAG: 3',5'-cyclic-nucleotide phosphodiesterase [Gallionellales bacterium 24-53-125]OZB10560.1 MAG: 3',5'-cyclic-nucleotide phosphodiesterase [Gallionellales bacterium 39-52-133]HQS57186.1 3',5'-cyclic-nucleotide phosphodiesterase [Gallionellaceae bacterium]HQS74626.1 3',5'-cyclic-nucleotide phosphodiesterase [Gallionellaceae bacterium]